jgi:hypothetical protein
VPECRSLTTCRDLEIAAFEADSHLSDIENFVFDGRQSLRSIAILSVVTFRGRWFSSCGLLGSVTFLRPCRLTRIRKYRRAGCEFLRRFVIRASVTEIDVQAFDGCAIRQLEIEEGSVSFGVQNQFLLAFASGFVPRVVGSPESIRIPFWVQHLTPYCCAWKKRLRTVEFEPSSKLRFIDPFTFFGCKSLTSICIPPFVAALPQIRSATTPGSKR